MSRVEEMYGTLVFNRKTMQEYLPRSIYKELMTTIDDGEPLNENLANVVAHSMKEWAIEKGATHYTHWFQPLSGITSEKHDSFIDPVDDSQVIMRFSGKALIQGEPDASSFPSGGLRATFEARGYTAWDPTSYAFIKDEVLCIPTAFCSYNGEALDKKTPLLRSNKAIKEQVQRVLALFGEEARHVVPTLGAEQEYFLISEEDYKKRLDLILCGRTLFGYSPCKGQELEEHYFGAIRPTVNEFMKELDDELWKLGVPAMTKHNEVAPCQHELAPMFTNVNRAIDQNLLTMEKMRLIASHHGLVCLESEKPFDHINGSGKHNNWSISVDGKNLLEPGDDPIQNMRFIVMLTCIIRAVDEYQDLLRMTTATAGNDHRLGGDEAPPSIISMFLGDELDRVVTAIMEGSDYHSNGNAKMDLGVDVLPNFDQDNTDRNRTSPFAFTGNKFEFRMPGSAQNLSDVNMVLNTAMADSLCKFADDLEGKSGEEFNKACQEWIRETLKAHCRIIFNGDGYSKEWEEEAKRRGLSNLKDTAKALPALVTEKSYALFSKFSVLNKDEVDCRYNVKLEKYNKTMNIECRTMKRMVRRDYLPAIENYAAELAETICSVEKVVGEGKAKGQRRRFEQICEGAANIHKLCDLLHQKHHQARDIEDGQKKADMYAEEVIPIMQELRHWVDSMEIITERKHWPCPTYNEILFYA
ncbi:glutamine synthetase III [Phoenicibacter congonensis]|uniref:glutamine synthetase III family protein n=1 Tax=Phoenicibacter congonensis TaxID=1944646 RepID=UPI0009A75A58|nr:glutamine synthetase III [Phoenicibacter congonensis]